MKLNTIDGAFLWSQPLRPPNFVVDTLISRPATSLEGLAQGGQVLAGPMAGGDSGQG